MSSTHQNEVKLEGGNVVIEMLRRNCEDIETTHALSCQVANILQNEFLISELSRLLCILFEKPYNVKNDMGSVTAWMESECAEYLYKVTIFCIFVVTNNTHGA
ncbi:hypothetical protein ILUMI_12509 [Ignelater luminosus]|uniref:Uncharacterized protein n=1 Tax=Ignelater luminosus TaxID=2038154 RepID=A0A8K0GBQ4_IGNLU|nr:hypothetical protein ILUMI_12509 [Ignelater luminosus]